MNVIVFGAAGMLGHMVADFLYENKNDYNQLTFTVRNEKREKFQARWPDAKVVSFDVIGDLLHPFLRGNDYAINCIGMINKLIDENDQLSSRLATYINTAFPRQMADAAGETKTKVLHPSTDCVFSGSHRVGNGYTESDKPDATDVYGKTKADGENTNPMIRIIRCSIIGPELGTKNGLLEWFLSRKQGETINGWQDHFWNGITTLAYAKLFHTVITQKLDLPPLHHFIPADYLHKGILLDIFADVYNRKDLQINQVNSPTPIFKNLDTIHKKLNNKLWGKMGYKNIPTIAELIKEMKEWQDKKY